MQDEPPEDLVTREQCTALAEKLGADWKKLAAEFNYEDSELELIETNRRKSDAPLSDAAYFLKFWMVGRVVATLRATVGGGIEVRAAFCPNSTLVQPTWSTVGVKDNNMQERPVSMYVGLLIRGYFCSQDMEREKATVTSLRCALKEVGLVEISNDVLGSADDG